MGNLLDSVCKAGDLSGCLIFVNNALGGGLLDHGNSLFEALLGLIYRIGSDGGSNIFDRLFDPCLVTLVSDSFYFILSRPFEG